MNLTSLFCSARTKFVVLFFAITVGVLSVLPQFLAPMELGRDYKGVQYLYLDDEDIYRARIQEILDGHLTVSSPYLYEYKETPMVVPPVGEYFYAIPALLFGLSNVIVFSKFFFPAVLFLLIYFLTTSILHRIDESSRILAALTTGLLVTLGFDFVDVHWVLSVIRGGNVSAHFVPWTRLVNPTTGILLVFTFLIVLWRMYERNSITNILIGGIIIATTIGYFFSFGVVLALLGSHILFALFLKEYKFLRSLIMMFLVSFLIDAPFWFSLLTAGGGREVLEKTGMNFTHEPVFNKVVFASTLFFLLSLYIARRRGWKYQEKRPLLFLGAMVLSGWVVFNQQVITGREIWYYHFIQYTTPLSFVVVVLISALIWRPMIPRMWASLMYLLIVVSLAWGIASVASYKYHMEDFTHLQNYGGVFSYLNSHEQKDCVVLIKETNDELERLIPAYTHCNVYNTVYEFTGITKERILHNFLLRMRLAGVTAEGAQSYLLLHKDAVKGHFYANWAQLFGSSDAPWVNSQIAIISEQYKFFMSEKLIDQVKTYRVDELISDHPLSNDLLLSLPVLSLATSTSGYYFYEFEHLK